MKAGLLEQIKERGYWRINYQPVEINRLDGLEKWRNLLQKSTVSLRGWSYPQVPYVNNERHEMKSYGEYYEAWVDFGAHKEFWRCYKSTQFLYYKAFREDWFESDGWYKEVQFIKPNSSLALVNTIYEITEIFTFLQRLIENGLYESGVTVNIKLNNLQERSLWIEDRNRVPLAYPRSTETDEFGFSYTYKKDEILLNSKQLANKVTRELFELFDFHPTIEQIQYDQDKLLSGR